MILFSKESWSTKALLGSYNMRHNIFWQNPCPFDRNVRPKRDFPESSTIHMLVDVQPNSLTKDGPVTLSRRTSHAIFTDTVPGTARGCPVIVRHLSPGRGGTGRPPSAGLTWSFNLRGPGRIQSGAHVRPAFSPVGSINQSVCGAAIGRRPE